MVYIPPRPALKHVLVLHHEGASNEFLVAQNLNDSRSEANFDSSIIFKPVGKKMMKRVLEQARKRDPESQEELSEDAQRIFDHEKLLKGMQSKDGIQFYHFKRKYPARVSSHFVGQEHLTLGHDQIENDWLNEIGKLDAVVITDGARENIRTIEWLESLKKQWPKLIVLVTNPTIHGPDEDASEGFYVQAKASLPERHPHRGDGFNRGGVNLPYVPVTTQSEHFTLRGATIATPERHEGQNAEILRQALGMPKLKSEYRGRE